MRRIITRSFIATAVVIALLAQGGCGGYRPSSTHTVPQVAPKPAVHAVVVHKKVHMDVPASTPPATEGNYCASHAAVGYCARVSPSQAKANLERDNREAQHTNEAPATGYEEHERCIQEHPEDQCNAGEHP